MSKDRIRIQNFLSEIARTFPFLPVEYSVRQIPPTEPGQTVSLKEDIAQGIAPVTVLVNETAARWESDDSFGRYQRRSRSAWRFEMILAFDREVLLERFEESLTDPVLRLTLNAPLAYSNVALNLVSASIEHPAQQQAAGGTKVTYTFEIEPHRL